MYRILLTACVLALGCPNAAFAAAPEPAKPLDPPAYMGRWYEVARIHNKLQLDCEAPTMDFTATGGGRFSMTETCRKGSPSGRSESHKGNVRILDTTTNAKIRVGFLGGLMSKDYWVIDHAPDNRWAMLATPDGRFLWLISRTPVLAERPQILARAKTLGFDLSRLEFAKQPPA